LELASGSVEKVAVFGPSHRMPIEGLALTSAATFAMPGFGLAADGEGVDALYSEAGARFVDAAHSEEHSIEVHLPFIRKVLGEVALTAVAVGESPPEEVGRAITTLLEDPRRTVVVSSDLSHYLDYDSASALDASTAEAILSLRFEDIGYDQACGRNCIRGLLWAARRLELEPELLDLRNSGDTAGTRDSVVGYPAFAFWNGTA
jgi:AmmeMemoRadiSam system protein B